MKEIKSGGCSLSLNILSRERSALMGIAMVWIVFFHMTIRIPEHCRMLSFVKGMGNIGVDMFLLLSGTGLYYSYEKLSNREIRWKEFYKKRFWRIAPAVVICLLPWFTYLQFLTPTSFARYLLDITSLSFWRDGRNPGWYMAMTIILYVLYPIVFHTIDPANTKKNIMAFFMWGGVFILLSSIIKQYNSDYYWEVELALSRFPVFFCGCFIAPEIRRERRITVFFKIMLYGITVFLIYMIYHSPQGIGGIYELTRYAYCPVSFGLLLIFSELFCRFHVPLLYTGFKWIGQYTLEIYLLHTQILSVCSRYLLPALEVWEMPHSNLAVNLIAAALSFITAIIVKDLEAGIMKRKEKRIPEKTEKNRDERIMFIRAAAVFMIITCHILQFYGNFLAYWFNAGVEIFLILSGLLYGQKDISSPFIWIKRQWKKILVPYWLFSLAAIFLYFLFAGEYVSVSGCVGLLLACTRFPGLGHLWFIPYILYLYLMTPLMQWTYDEYLARQSDRKVFEKIVLLTGILWLLRYYGLENFAENRLVCYYGGYFLGRRYLHKERTEGRNAAMAKKMSRVVCLAALTAVLRGLVQYHSLDEVIPCWPYFLPFIHSLMGFGLFWLLYLAGGKIKVQRSPVIRIVDKYSFEIYLVHHIFILGAGRLNCMEVFSWKAANYMLLLVFIAASAGMLHFILDLLKIRDIFQKEEMHGSKNFESCI